MTRFLASVSNLHEAGIVYRAGVDILDLKNPAEGALGAITVNTISEIVSQYHNHIPISATVGDIYDMDKLHAAIETIQKTHVDIIKVGLFQGFEKQAFVEIVNCYAAQGVQIVVVCFADQMEDISEINHLLVDCDAYGFMLDTLLKQAGLLTYYSVSALESFVSCAKAHNKLTGLAGSLKHQDLETVLPLQPDYVGFRGALCLSQQRTSTINEQAVYRIRKSIFLENQKRLMHANNMH